MGNWAHYVHLQMRGKRCSCAMGDTIGLGFIGFLLYSRELSGRLATA